MTSTRSLKERENNVDDDDVEDDDIEDRKGSPLF